MTRRCFLISIGLACVAPGAAASPLAGRWSGYAEGAQGREPIVLILKVEGTTLTGEIRSPREVCPIADGRVTDNRIRFHVQAKVRGRTVRVDYAGVVREDEIELSRELEVMGSTDRFLVRRTRQ